MASQWPPKKNTAFTLYFTLYKNDGTVIANPGTYTKKVSIDGGAMADVAASVTEEDTTYGQLSLVIASGEMNGDAIWIQVKDDTAGCIPLTVTLYTAADTQDEVKAACLTATGFATPTNITAGTITTVTTLTNAPGDSTGTTELLTRIPDATAGAAGGLPTVAAGGVALQQTVTLVAGQTIAATVAGSVNSVATGVTLAASQHVIVDSGTVTTLTGHTAQTGDVYAQLPANLIHLAITDTTGLVDITQGAADKAWGTAARVLTAATNLTAGITDAVWDEVLHTDHEVASSASVLVQAAGTASDPWLTALPGAYGAGTAGRIMGRSLPDVTAGAATGLAIVGSEMAANVTKVNGAAQTATLDTIKAETVLIVADTGEMQGDLAQGGRLDLILDAAAADALAAHTAIDDGTSGLAALHTDLGTAQTMLTDIHGTDLPAVKVDTAAVKVQTDKLAFTVANQVDANIQSINDVSVTGNGGTGTEFGV